MVAYQTGNHSAAIELLEKAIQKAPAAHDYYNNCGEAYRAVHEYDMAIARYQKAIAINPDCAEAYNNYGNALQELGQLDEAIQRYQKALSIKPDYAEAHHNLAAAVQELGRIEEAIAHYEEALVLEPSYASARRQLVMLDPRPGHVPIIEKLLANKSISAEHETHLRFALGRIFDATGSYEKAFENYSKANALKRKTLNYDSKAHSKYVDYLIRTYTKQYFREKAGFGLDSSLPVFIVGMPRSGTTLVEQIISSHPEVFGAGELYFVGNFERFLLSQNRLRLVDRSTTRTLAEQYITALNAHSTAHSRIVDKMPSNFLRLGLIKTLFPNARVIHCRRNALDTCLSIYFQFFATGNEYAFDLEELAAYYLEYQRLMSHWTDIGLPDVFDVQYEELVENQEVVSKRMIEHLALEWDSRCLDFHKNLRPVRTASVFQVRKRLYKDSILKSKKYSKYLDSLKSALVESIR